MYGINCNHHNYNHYKLDHGHLDDNDDHYHNQEKGLEMALVVKSGEVGTVQQQLDPLDRLSSSSVSPSSQYHHH